MTRLFAWVTVVAGLTLGALGSASPVRAEQFTPLSSRESFVSVIAGRDLRRLGIRLTVSPDGRITGRAFGTEVRGQWNWDGRYFCRTLSYGSENFEYNCQTVQLSGRTLRFTADLGRGESADLTIR